MTHAMRSAFLDREWPSTMRQPGHVGTHPEGSTTHDDGV